MELICLLVKASKKPNITCSDQTLGMCNSVYIVAFLKQNKIWFPHDLALIIYGFHRVKPCLPSLLKKLRINPAKLTITLRNNFILNEFKEKSSPLLAWKDSFVRRDPIFLLDGEDHNTTKSRQSSFAGGPMIAQH